MFEKVSSQKLRELAEVLGSVYAERLEDMKVAQFARTLSVVMRCELARRKNDDE